MRRLSAERSAMATYSPHHQFDVMHQRCKQRLLGPLLAAFGQCGFLLFQDISGQRHTARISDIDAVSSSSQREDGVEIAFMWCEWDVNNAPLECKRHRPPEFLRRQVEDCVHDHIQFTADATGFYFDLLPTDGNGTQRPAVEYVAHHRHGFRLAVRMRDAG